MPVHSIVNGLFFLRQGENKNAYENFILGIIIICCSKRTGSDSDNNYYYHNRHHHNNC